MSADECQFWASPWVAILTVALVNSLLYIRNLSLPVGIQKKQASSMCSRVCEERDGWGVMDVADTVVSVYVKIRNWVPGEVVVMSDHMSLVTSWQSKKMWLLHDTVPTSAHGILCSCVD